ILNAQPQISWELGTLVEILICVSVFLVSGLFENKSASYKRNVEGLFKRLATPLTEAQKPVENRGFQTAMNKLYAVALLVTGSLFIVMSIPSIKNTSGISSVVAGAICLLLAGLMWFLNRRGASLSRGNISATAKPK